MKTARELLDYELVDDEKDYGGKSFSDETLRDFLDELGWSYDTSMEEINDTLEECGIEPIPYWDDEPYMCFEVETTYKSGRFRSEIITAKNEEEFWKYYDKHHNAKLIEDTTLVDAWQS